MSDFDLSDLDLKELKKLHKETAAAIENYEARRRQDALAAAEAAAKAAGFSLKELVDAPTRTASKSINPPKYRNPENPSQTWSGRGRQPQWIKDALAANTSLDEFLINK